MSALLTDEVTGAPVSGKTIAFFFSGNSANATTDKDGLASTTWNAGASTGTQRIAAAFSSDSTHIWSTKLGWFTVTSPAGGGSKPQDSASCAPAGAVLTLRCFLDAGKGPIAWKKADQASPLQSAISAAFQDPDHPLGKYYRKFLANGGQGLDVPLAGLLHGLLNDDIRVRDAFLDLIEVAQRDPEFVASWGKIVGEHPEVEQALRSGANARMDPGAKPAQPGIQPGGFDGQATLANAMPLSAWLKLEKWQRLKLIDFCENGCDPRRACLATGLYDACLAACTDGRTQVCSPMPEGPNGSGQGGAAPTAKSPKPKALTNWINNVTGDGAGIAYEGDKAALTYRAFDPSKPYFTAKDTPLSASVLKAAKDAKVAGVALNLDGTVYGFYKSNEDGKTGVVWNADMTGYIHTYKAGDKAGEGTVEDYVAPYVP
ncbi:MAG: hypothetical protein HY925_03920 [Elusimicrobia bacterium]|nr:hypothetical protein [Elusimicrobiota bacterium]